MINLELSFNPDARESQRKRIAYALANLPDIDALLLEISEALALKNAETSRSAVSLTAISEEISDELAEVQVQLDIDTVNKDYSNAHWERGSRKMLLQQVQRLVETVHTVYPQEKLVFLSGPNNSWVLDPTRLSLESIMNVRSQVSALLDEFDTEVTTIAERDAGLMRASITSAENYLSVVLAVRDGYLTFNLTPNMDALEELGDHADRRARDLVRLLNDELNPQQSVERKQAEEKVVCGSCGTIYMMSGHYYSCPNCGSNEIKPPKQPGSIFR